MPDVKVGSQQLSPSLQSNPQGRNFQSVNTSTVSPEEKIPSERQSLQQQQQQPEQKPEKIEEEVEQKVEIKQEKQQPSQQQKEEEKQQEKKAKEEEAKNIERSRSISPPPRLPPLVRPESKLNQEIGNKDDQK